MKNIKVNIQAALISEQRKILKSNTHEAVLYFYNKKYKNKKNYKINFWGVGTRPTHKKLLPQLVEANVLSEECSSPIPLYNQKEAWKVQEITLHSLGNINLTETSSWFQLESLTNRCRMAGGNVIRCHLQNLKRKKDTVLVIDLSEWRKVAPLEIKWKNLISAFIEGLYLGGYQYMEYKKPSPHIKDITITLMFKASDLRRLKKIKVFTQAQIVSEGVYHARNLVNDPPNSLSSEVFVNQARKIASNLKVGCQIFTKSQLKDMQMNALLSVNAGSHHEAKLVVLDNHLKEEKKRKTILLVGKGVLFDSGGLSLKPASAMSGMKMDMAGAATVISAFESLIKMKTKARVVAIIPLTDNMTGENAMKVGDIITTHSGKTVEVLNTDAEGRLILCDALSYGIKTYEPDYIIDIATLTGACIVALGNYYAGLFTSGDKLATKLIKSSQATDEPIWRMPLDDLYLKELQSDIADLKNIGSNYGGAITAAKFLEQFVPENYRPHWAHLDIASVMDYSKTKGYHIKGGSGFGVRLIVNFVQEIY